MTYRSARHFACEMLRDNRLGFRPAALHPFRGGVSEACLYREGCWQVELVVAPPHAYIPRHRHDRVDSWDIAMAGAVHLRIDGVDHVIHAGAIRPDASLAAQLLHVPRGVWHSGNALDEGSVYLSFQQWYGEGAPGLISEDWIPWTKG